MDSYIAVEREVGYRHSNVTIVLKQAKALPAFPILRKCTLWKTQIA